MSKLYRTAFAAPSGFVATASAPKAAGPSTDRKPLQPGRPTAKPARDPKLGAHKPTQAA